MSDHGFSTPQGGGRRQFAWGSSSSNRPFNRFVHRTTASGGGSTTSRRWFNINLAPSKLPAICMDDLRLMQPDFADLAQFIVQRSEELRARDCASEHPSPGYDVPVGADHEDDAQLRPHERRLFHMAVAALIGALDSGQRHTHTYAPAYVHEEARMVAARLNELCGQGNSTAVGNLLYRAVSGIAARSLDILDFPISRRPDISVTHWFDLDGLSYLFQESLHERALDAESFPSEEERELVLWTPKRLLYGAKPNIKASADTNQDLRDKLVELNSPMALTNFTRYADVTLTCNSAEYANALRRALGLQAEWASSSSNPDSAELFPPQNDPESDEYAGKALTCPGSMSVSQCRSPTLLDGGPTQGEYPHKVFCLKGGSCKQVDPRELMAVLREALAVLDQEGQTLPLEDLGGRDDGESDAVRPAELLETAPAPTPPFGRSPSLNGETIPVSSQSIRMHVTPVPSTAPGHAYGRKASQPGASTVAKWWVEYRNKVIRDLTRAIISIDASKLKTVTGQYFDRQIRVVAPVTLVLGVNETNAAQQSPEEQLIATECKLGRGGDCEVYIGWRGDRDANSKETSKLCAVHVYSPPQATLGSTSGASLTKHIESLRRVDNIHSRIANAEFCERLQVPSSSFFALKGAAADSSELLSYVEKPGDSDPVKCAISVSDLALGSLAAYARASRGAARPSSPGAAAGASGGSAAGSAEPDSVASLLDDDLANIALQCIEALSELHNVPADVYDASTWHKKSSFLAHGDVHEGNFLINRRGKIVLTDFGATENLKPRDQSWGISASASTRIGSSPKMLRCAPEVLAREHFHSPQFPADLKPASLVVFGRGRAAFGLPDTSAAGDDQDRADDEPITVPKWRPMRSDLWQLGAMLYTLATRGGSLVNTFASKFDEMFSWSGAGPEHQISELHFLRLGLAMELFNTSIEVNDKLEVKGKTHCCVGQDADDAREALHISADASALSWANELFSPDGCFAAVPRFDMAHLIWCLTRFNPSLRPSGDMLRSHPALHSHEEWTLQAMKLFHDTELYKAGQQPNARREVFYSFVRFINSDSKYDNRCRDFYNKPQLHSAVAATNRPPQHAQPEDTRCQVPDVGEFSSYLRSLTHNRPLSIVDTQQDLIRRVRILVAHEWQSLKSPYDRSSGRPRAQLDLSAMLQALGPHTRGLSTDTLQSGLIARAEFLRRCRATAWPFAAHWELRLRGVQCREARYRAAVQAHVAIEEASRPAYEADMARGNESWVERLRRVHGVEEPAQIEIPLQVQEMSQTERQPHAPQSTVVQAANTQEVVAAELNVVLRSLAMLTKGDVTDGGLMTLVLDSAEEAVDQLLAIIVERESSLSAVQGNSSKWVKKCENARTYIQQAKLQDDLQKSVELASVAESLLQSVKPYLIKL